VLVVDDFGHAGHYAADLVLNQNLHAAAALYRDRASDTRLLLGTRFALLRREFRAWHGGKREVPELARKVLVTLGGSDPDGVTLTAIEALDRIRWPGLEVVVLLGGGTSRLAELEAAAGRAAGTIRLRRNVTDMPELMAWADVAVAAGGTTTWERALLGLPSLVVVLAENQKDLAEASERVGIGWNLGPHQGLSASTLAGALRRLLADASARADCRLIWEWANEPATRAASFSEEPIPWEQHRGWFAARLDDTGCLFFIALDAAGEPVGQVRLDIDGDVAVISIGLASGFHGLGYGPEVIRRAVRELLASRPVARIDAFIRAENTASYRAFLKAGFADEEATAVRGHSARRLAFHKEGT
jgi:RimJ/RimL family protein N-acetyltransferase